MQEKIWKIQASYTVEASYIMSMVILSLAVLIRAAYGQYLESFFQAPVSAGKRLQR